MSKICSFFESASNSGRDQIASLSPDKADAFQKILKSMADLTEKCSIIESTMMMGFSNTAIVVADVEPLIGGGVNMHFRSSQKSLNLLRSMKGNTEYLILNDPTHKEYIISNGNQSVKFPQIMPTEPLTIPDLSLTNADAIAENFITDESSLIKSFAKGSPYITIHVFKDQIGCFERQDGHRYYIGEFSWFEYENIQPDYVFRSFSFLPIVGELVTFGIYKLNVLPDMFCLRTTVIKGIKMEINFFDRITLIGRR